MDRYSLETLLLAHEEFRRFQSEIKDETGTEVKFYTMHLSFTKFREKRQQNFFLNIPTSFFLPTAAVDELEKAGRDLLRESSTFQNLLDDLGAEWPSEGADLKPKSR